MVDGGDIDHADSKVSLVTRTYPVGPAHKVARQRKHVPGVVQDRLGGGTQNPSPAGRLEQVDADTTLEFGQALRQRTRRHTKLARCGSPGRSLGYRNQVFELADREIGKHQRLGHKHTVPSVRLFSLPSLFLLSMKVPLGFHP